MSFSQIANENVLNFIKAVAQQFSISEDELKNIWNGKKSSPSSSAPAVSAPAATPSPAVAAAPSFLPTPVSPEMSKMTVAELQSLCKMRGLKSTGKKQELIDRLSGSAPATAVTTSSPAQAAAPTPVNNTKKKAPEDSVPKAVKLVQSTLQPVCIKKNSFGNFENAETGFVFDKITQKVIGKQNKSGAIDALNDSDIEVCNKFKFKFVIPENLNATSAHVAASIEGIDDENGTEDASDPTDTLEEVVEEEEEVVEEEEEVVEEQEYFEDEE